MKRAALLHVAGCDLDRFKTLLARDQLPASIVGPDYSLAAGFELRLVLDLIGNERDAEALGGLAPSLAHRVVANLRDRWPWHPLRCCFGGPELWGGVVVLEDQPPDRDPFRYAAWFAGTADELAPWLAQRREAEGGQTGHPVGAVRIHLANATGAAAFVRRRAMELGLPEGEDFPEARP